MRRSNRIAVGTVLGVGGVILVGGYAVMYGQFGRYASQRDAEFAAARAEGIPLEAKDLVRAVPKLDNAAPIYVDAIKALQDKSLAADLKLLNGVDKANASLQEVAAAEVGLRKFGPMLAEVQRASDLKECAFDREWSLGPNLLLPEYAHMKTFSRMLAVRAEISSAKGDWRSALRDIQTSYRMARHTGQDPILIAMLVEVAQENIAHRAFERVLSDHGTNPTFLREAARVQAQVGALPNFRHAMGGEIIFGRTAIPMIDSHAVFVASPNGETPKPFFLEKAFFQSAPVQGAFETRLLQFWRETYRDLPSDPAQWEEALKAMEKQQTRLDADQSPANWANQILMPVFSQAAAINGKVIAQRHLNATSLRLLAERAKTGAFPTTLSKEWGDEILDPYTGKPLTYKVEGNGFRLWSIAEDRKDDKGLTQMETVGTTYDLVVRYPVPARPKTRPVQGNGGGFPAPGPGLPGGPPMATDF